jgi:hypothetical protein
MPKARFMMLAAVCACGQVPALPLELDANPQPDEGIASDAPAAVDAPMPFDALAPTNTPPPRCNPTAQFGPPEAIDAINTSGSNEFAHLSPDELTMYFSSNRGGSGYDIFQATRRDLDDSWEVKPVLDVNTAEDERHPVVTGDGRTMYAVVGRNPTLEIAIAARDSSSGVFSRLAPIPRVSSSGDPARNVNSDQNDEVGFVLPDDSALWFSSNRNGRYELYRAQRNSEVLEAFKPDGTGINETGVSDEYPVVTLDELTLFFTSNRILGAVGANDIWMTRRATTAAGFARPENLSILNTSRRDVPTWISPDGCVLYLMSDAADGRTSIFHATRGR